MNHTPIKKLSIVAMVTKHNTNNVHLSCRMELDYIADMGFHTDNLPISEFMLGYTSYITFIPGFIVE